MFQTYFIEQSPAPRERVPWMEYSASVYSYFLVATDNETLLPTGSRSYPPPDGKPSRREEGYLNIVIATTN